MLTDRTPYIYFLYWEAKPGVRAQMYIGSQRGKGCHPDNLWTKYFTSSWMVQRVRDERGEPDKIFTIECTDYEGQAGKMEELFLRKVNAERNPQFINMTNVGRSKAKYKPDQIQYVYGLLWSIEEVAYALSTSPQNVANKLNYLGIVDWGWEPRNPKGRTVVSWCKGDSRPRGSHPREPLPLLEG